MADALSSSSSSSASTASASPSASDAPASSFNAALCSIFRSAWDTGRSTTKKSPASDGEGVVAFPSRGAAEFRYRLSRSPQRDAIRIWLEDKRSKQQWESKELALSDIVTDENAIPSMQLKDYFEAFKSSLLAADTGLCRGANKHDLVALKRGVDKSMNTDDKDAPKTPRADKSDDAPAKSDDAPAKSDDDDADERLELQLTLAVHVFSKVITPTYRFELRAVKLTEMDVVNARLRDQSEEIAELRAEVADLSRQLSAAPRSHSPPSPFGFSPPGSLFGAPQTTVCDSPVYLRATTAQATRRDHAMEWSCAFGQDNSGWFQLLPQGGVRVLRAGVFSVHVVVQHTNTFNPNNAGLFGSPPAGREAFHLAKNGETVALSFGSTDKGAVLSSPLAHLLPLVPSDELTVVYCGTGVAMPGSSFTISRIR